MRLERGKWGAPASPRKPAVVLGSIKEKSALTRVPRTYHCGCTCYLQGDRVGEAYIASCFGGRRRGVNTVNYVSIQLGHRVPRCLLSDLGVPR